MKRMNKLTATEIIENNFNSPSQKEIDDYLDEEQKKLYLEAAIKAQMMEIPSPVIINRSEMESVERIMEHYRNTDKIKPFLDFFSSGNTTI